MILFAPLALFYLKVVSHQENSLSIGFWDVCKSVLIFLGAPLCAGVLTRYGVISLKGKKWFDEKFVPVISPIALIALIYTILVLFALQGQEVVRNIGDVFRVAVPMLFYFAIMWSSSFLLSGKLKNSYEDTVSQSFTAASNNFELAIAIAVGTFGVNSQEALAATVGPLIEVPVLLMLVHVALWLQKKFKWTKTNNL
jgi:ACR3 family arsenite transporter